jgi:hypothetical protein
MARPLVGVVLYEGRALVGVVLYEGRALVGVVLYEGNYCINLLYQIYFKKKTYAFHAISLIKQVNGIRKSPIQNIEHPKTCDP